MLFATQRAPSNNHSPTPVRPDLPPPTRQTHGNPHRTVAGFPTSARLRSRRNEDKPHPSKWTSLHLISLVCDLSCAVRNHVESPSQSLSRVLTIKEGVRTRHVPVPATSSRDRLCASSRGAKVLARKRLDRPVRLQPWTGGIPVHKWMAADTHRWRRCLKGPGRGKMPC
jgi:hypothetical protein